eukprot:TRINITY_DN147444_c0_g1_i1.p1 TRINITY_DN147444_c0_g1~~TRINITY_DN147444_c0_g1_i1.p1  ORF type:complete len:117 (+),score=13.15 TRINITY_DN147444_c0_g1_i1:1-351(+)
MCIRDRCVMTVTGQAVICRRTPKYRIALSPTQRSVYPSVHVMGKVVVIHAVCWLALGLVTIMNSQNVYIFNEIHGTMVVFVLPFNSALNPLLYLWTVKTQWQSQHQEDKLLSLIHI